MIRIFDPLNGYSRRISSYTIFGFLGYGIANVVGALLAAHWELTLGERLIGFFTPPLAFIVVVTIATAIAGRELIVFYQTACTGIAAVVVAAVLAGARVERLLDLTVLGIGVFLVFGRLGCHSVACCHGRLGRGVVYGPSHVALGFWSRWSGRALWPVQLIEASVSAVLVIVGVAISDTPGRASLAYIVGYSAVRFMLELYRGDGARSYARGLSEAQWIALGCLLVCASWQPSLATIAVASLAVAAATFMIATRRRRERFSPRHLRDLDRALVAAMDGARHETSCGVAVSRHILPDGRVDWILSAAEPPMTEAVVRRLAHELWEASELIPGKTPGVFHVVTAR